MRKSTFVLVAAVLFVLPSSVVLAQKHQAKCENSPVMQENFDLHGDNFVFFDSILCPPGLKPAAALVTVWITTQGNGYSLEKWAEDRDGADKISVFRGETKAYNLYRDLSAIPLTVFKAESRKHVPADIAKEPFIVEGSKLIPLGNLTQESAERAKRAFGYADEIVRAAQNKISLALISEKLGSVADALKKELREQN